MVSKYFSMHSAKPPTITQSARGRAAGKWPQRNRAPSAVARLPQVKPGGSRKRVGKDGGWEARASAAPTPIDRVRVSLIGITGLQRPSPVGQVFSLPLNHASDASLRILQLMVVRYVTARCTCSGSAAGFLLQVERREFGQTGNGHPYACSGGFTLTTSTICASLALATPQAARSALSIMPIRQFNGCRSRN
jgi:hypothetical protein